MARSACQWCNQRHQHRELVTVAKPYGRTGVDGPFHICLRRCARLALHFGYTATRHGDDRW